MHPASSDKPRTIYDLISIEQQSGKIFTKKVGCAWRILCHKVESICLKNLDQCNRRGLAWNRHKHLVFFPKKKLFF